MNAEQRGTETLLMQDFFLQSSSNILRTEAPPTGFWWCSMFVRDPLVSHIQNNNAVIRDVLQVQECCSSWVTVSWLGYISKADRTLLKDVKHTLSYKYKHNTQNHSRQTWNARGRLRPSSCQAANALRDCLNTKLITLILERTLTLCWM